MVRTVRVRLELDRDEFKRGLRDAATETRGFDAEVRSAGKDTHAMGVEVKSTGTQVEAMGREVDAAAKKTTGLGDEAAKAKTKTTGLGEESKKTRQNIVDLAKDIDKTKTALAAMGEEFRKTGSVDMDKFKSLSTTLRDLERVKAGVSKGVQDGMKDGADRGLKDVGTIATSNPYIAAGIAAAVILGAPVIGAAVSSAVLLGVGAGTLAGGIALAAKDPRVADAWSELGTSAKDKLSGAAEVFVDPLVRGSQTFGATLNAVLPRIRRDFELIAPSLDRLFTGLGGLVENAMPGFDAALAASQPFIDELARQMPAIGAAISDFFQTIASDSPGALQFFHDFLGWLQVGIQFTGNLVGGLSIVYGTMRGLSQVMSGDMSGVYTMWQSWQDGATGAGVASLGASTAIAAVRKAIVPVGQEASITGDQFKTLSGQISATAQTADVLKGQMVGQLLNSMMSLDQATLGFARSQTSLGDSIKQNGLDLDIHTAKGEQNRSAILSSVQANMAQYQANIAVGMSAEDAAKAYDTNTTALEDQLRAAHFTQEEIDGLIGKYRHVPDKVDTDIATNGLTTAIENLDALIRRINNIPTRRDIYVTEHINSVIHGGQSPDRLFDYPGVNRWGGAYEHAAVGTLREASTYSAKSPGRYMIAEPQTQGEAFIPKSGDYGRSMSILSHAASWYGARVMPGGSGGASMVNVNVTVRDDTGRLLQVIAKEVSARGGDVQAVLGS